MQRGFRVNARVVMITSAALIAVATGWWIAKQVSQPEAPVESTLEAPEKAPTRRTVHLYFGDAQGRYLVAEQRVVDQPADDVALGRQLVQMLIQGPEKGGSRTLPADAKVRAFFINDPETAVVDFESDSFANHPGGVGCELLSIYSLVNTLALNVERIHLVKILIGGQEAATLVGHVDLQTPFEVDMLWVR
ncbi:MAG: GerMN domain-containing protein [Desulfobacteraceae bacterium]|nr:GerMN domain-containing protein [Desulfobacteraceae bacterium]